MHPSRPRTTTAVGALARATVVVLLAALGFLGVGAGPAAADSDVPWAVSTASNDFGSGRQNYSYTLNPGGQLTDGLVVVNHGTTPLDLAVYAADGFTTDTGQLDLLTKDGKSVGIGVWVHADGGSVTIQPGKSAEVPFKVTVPDNATPGDYVGGIVTSLTQADAAEGINVDRRLGIRIKLRVGGELKPNLVIEDLHVGYAGSFNPLAKSDATVTYKIHNTGNAILSAQQTVSVSGPFGWLRVEAGEIASPPELLPGESREVTVPVHGVAPAVRLAATATLTPLLTDASGSTTSLEPVRATTHGWATPWTLLLLVVVLIAVIAGVLLLARRSRVRRKRREDARVPEAVEQVIRDKEPQAR